MDEIVWDGENRGSSFDALTDKLAADGATSVMIVDRPVFKLDGSVEVEEFKNTLRENCDLVWNICTSADTIICENEGDVVLFAMLDMDEMTGLPKGTDEKIINNFHSILK